MKKSVEKSGLVKHFVFECKQTLWRNHQEMDDRGIGVIERRAYFYRI